MVTTKLILHTALAMPRIVKRTIVAVMDVVICILSVWIAFYLRLGEFLAFAEPNEFSQGFFLATLVSVVFTLPILSLMGVYRSVLRYGDWADFKILGLGLAIYSLLYAGIFTLIGVQGVPRTVGIIQPLLAFVIFLLFRIFASFILSADWDQSQNKHHKFRTLIYGAGTAGRQLASAIGKSKEIKIVGFVDDNPALQGQKINLYPVYDSKNLVSLVKAKRVVNVLLAMPSVARRRRNEILNKLRAANVSVRTLPSLRDIAEGSVQFSDIQELEVGDLLGRDIVEPDPLLISKNIRGKVVMVTGAGGSIGSELCRQILAVDPVRLIMVEQSEFALYSVHHELEIKLAANKSKLIPVLASVQDAVRMGRVIATWKPATIFHAAACKHVPMVEHNQSNGIETNVFGTLVTATAAADNGVEDFVLVSTDKAVRPTNIMGCSKRLAELVLQALADSGRKTKFSIVRFGNVLDSSGSVVPKFRNQLLHGGPITLTHSDVTRYFMTIPEAAQLVIQAGAMSKGGDVFVLDMGPPIKIIDLALRMIQLSGLSLKDEDHPDGDVEIQIVGLRPGEKLYEELLIGNNPQRTMHPKIMAAKEEFIAWPELEKAINRIWQALQENDLLEIRSLLTRLVAGYVPSEEILDWDYMERNSQLHLPASKMCSNSSAILC